MPRARVLVLEHHRDLCEALVDGLADEGYAVTSATSARAALAALGGAVGDPLPDAVVVDVLDGRDVLEALHREPRLSGIAVVALRYPFDRPADADVEVRRPFRLEQLLEALATALRQRGFPVGPAPHPAP